MSDSVKAFFEMQEEENYKGAGVMPTLLHAAKEGQQEKIGFKILTEYDIKDIETAVRLYYESKDNR